MISGAAFFFEFGGCLPDWFPARAPDILRSDSQNTQGVVLTVVIRNWKQFALEGMGRIFAMCLGLTIMVIAVFCYALTLNKRKQQLYYYNRTDIVLDLVQQLEIPLSTMSVAVEALGNDKVMYNSEKRHFFKQAINVRGQDKIKREGSMRWGRKFSIKAQPFTSKIHAVRVAGYNCSSVVGCLLQAGPAS
jgi:hypothetical protein